MSDWVAEMKAALDAEYGAKPRIAALATVDEGGRPRVRSVVCRRVEEDGSLWVASDARSDKNEQIRARPFGEMVFWLSTRREQFRVAGEMEVVRGDDLRRIPAWRDLSDSARALFLWEPPGMPIIGTGGDNPERVPADAAIPESFELLILHPDRAEHLDLKPHPHHRRRWREANGWEVEEIHP